MNATSGSVVLDETNTNAQSPQVEPDGCGGVASGHTNKEQHRPCISTKKMKQTAMMPNSNI